MGHLDRITELESRAHRVNLTLRGLCGSNGQWHQYLGRWKSGATEPTIRVFEKTMRVLEADLERRERELLGYLLERYSPADAIAPAVNGAGADAEARP